MAVPQGTNTPLQVKVCIRIFTEVYHKYEQQNALKVSKVVQQTAQSVLYYIIGLLLLSLLVQPVEVKLILLLPTILYQANCMQTLIL